MTACSFFGSLPSHVIAATESLLPAGLPALRNKRATTCRQVYRNASVAHCWEVDELRIVRGVFTVVGVPSRGCYECQPARPAGLACQHCSAPVRLECMDRDDGGMRVGLTYADYTVRSPES